MVKHGGSIVSPTFVKTGYTFNGWDKTIPEKMPAENITVTAEWKINQYTLTLVYGNGQEDKKITQDYETAIASEANPSRIGYTFDSWDKTIPEKMPAENLTITAQWLAIFTISNGRTITGLTSHGNTFTEINIPSKIDGVSITAIECYAFYNCSSLTSITIPDSVISIGDYAFYGCNSLDKVNYTGTIDQWGQIYFNDYTSNPTCYANDLYINNVLVTEANLTTATKINAYVFSNCSSLTSITIGNNVTSIESYAFKNCTSLTSITVPDSVTSIGEGAFNGCGNLEEITIPFIGSEAGKTLTDTYLYPFGYIFGTESYTSGMATGQYYYPDSTSSSIFVAYYIPVMLRKVTVTGGDILYGAFLNCSDLTSITIGNNVTSIGNYAFQVCSSLTEIKYNATECSDLSSDNNVYSGAGEVGKKITVTIGKNVKKIPAYLFYNALYVKEVVFENGSVCESIGENAFLGCSSSLYNEYDNAYYLGNETNKYLWLMGAKSTDITSCTINENCNFVYDGAFTNCGSLTSITIPDSVTSIGESAFRGCSSLTSVTISNSVTSIGDYMFYDCSSLTSITIPNSVTSIGEYAFRGCSSMTSVNIPNGVTSINEATFSMCSSLVSITIPNSVTSIGTWAFYQCSSLTSIEIPNSVTIIGDEAFYNCNLLENIYYNGDINDWVENIEGINNLMYCNTLFKNLYINEELLTEANITTATKINAYAFSGCSSLKSITIPNSVTSIGNYAFHGCNSLTSVTIPDSVMSIGEKAFYNCSKLASVTIGNSVTSIGNYAFYGCSSLTSITIPNSVTSIGEDAFYNCSSLTSVTIGESVTSIGGSAFYNCTLLTEINYNATKCAGLRYANFVFLNAGKDGTGIRVTIGKNVKWIPAYLFIPCNSTYSPVKITEVVFEKGSVCESIGGDVFGNCSSLTSITIPYSVTSIGSYAFEDCDSIENIYYNGDVNDWVQIEGISNLMGYGKSSKNLYISGELLTEANITTATKINTYAFRGCSSLKSITIPNSVTSIGGSAFYGCSMLTSITIPNSVTSIGDYMFYDCSSLTSITISNSVTSIGKHAFRGCSSLTSVNIPNGVTSIGDNAFYNCSLLSSITIGKNVTSIGSSAFYGCSTLTSITIPNSVTSIGEYAFRGCSSLTSVNIPNGVTSIKEATFSKCSSLVSITIPNNVTSIGTWAFYQCSSLLSMVIPNSVAIIESDAFSGCGSLESINVDKDNANYSSVDGILYNKSQTKFIHIPKGIKGPVTIPDSITSIERWVFGNCVSLVSITIPNSVTSIEYDAFYGCNLLTSVYYGGTAEQWANISIGSNSKLTDATRYYYSETKPTDEGNYWYYDENGNITVW